MIYSVGMGCELNASDSREESTVNNAHLMHFCKVPPIAKHLVIVITTDNIDALTAHGNYILKC